MSKMNFVEYAEQELRVHEVWLDAQERLEELGKIEHIITEHKNEIRSVEAQIDDVKLDILGNMGDVEFKSAAARKEMYKEACLLDVNIRHLQKSLVSLKNSLESAEADKVIVERRLHMTHARLNELNGLLQFYAAGKLAVVMEKPAK